MALTAARLAARRRPWGRRLIVGPRPGGGAPRRRDRRRQGRACLFWGLAFFALLQVTLGLYTEYCRPDLRDPTFEIKYRQLARRVAACPAPPVKVVFFGSSMTAHGIEAGLLEEPVARAVGRPAVVFNLGIHQSGPLSNLIYLRRLLGRGLRPDLAVIEVTPLVLDYPDKPGDAILFPGNRLERGEVAIVQGYSKDPDLCAEWREALLVPAHGHRLAILCCEAHFLVPFDDRLLVWEEMDEHGWLSQEVYDPERHRETLEHVRACMGPRLAAYTPGEPPRRALTEVLDLLRTERVPAVLLLMPEGPLLRSLYAPGADARLIEDIATLGRSYGVPMVRARDWLGEDQFVDSFHATCEGARVLTERLGREVIVPLLVRRLGSQSR
jgi:hypothetical protein